MESLIGLIIVVILFSIAAYGAWWVCTKFALPQPVFWIVGAILLLIILLYMVNQVGGIPHGTIWNTPAR